MVQPFKVRHTRINTNAPPRQQRLRPEAFSVGLIPEFNEALDVLWALNPMLHDTSKTWPAGRCAVRRTKWKSCSCKSQHTGDPESTRLGESPHRVA